LRPQAASQRKEGREIMRSIVFGRRFAVALMLFLFIAAAPASAASPQVIATGLSDPRGIDADDGDRGDRLLVAESTAARITEIFTRKGSDSDVHPFATLPAGSSLNGVLAFGWRSAFVTAGPGGPGSSPVGQLLKVRREGESSVVADIAAYQVEDPDPDDVENNPAESNPFGVAFARHGVLVTDAAGNDLLKVEKDGDIETVARFPTRKIEVQDLGDQHPSDLPPPGTPFDAESVPTGVAVGPDGAWYVAELRGFPFTPGTSRIWRIQPGAEDAECDPDAERGPCTVYADGFTSVMGIAWAGDTLLVLEIAKVGLLPVEAGIAPPIGALWAYDDGEKTEIAPGALQAPGGVDVADEERIYVTTGTLFGPSAGEVVRIKGALDEDGDDDDRGHGKGDHGGGKSDGDGRGHHGGDHHGDDDDDRGDRRHKSGKKHHKGGKQSSKHKNKKRYKRHRDD